MLELGEMSSLDSFFKNEERRKKEEKPRQEIQNKNIAQKPRKSMLLQGKITVLCPKLGEEVSARRYCIKCEYFSHVSYEGMLKPLIACKYNYSGG